MASPLWKYPGVLEGRLAPTQAGPYGYDVGQLYYYSTYWVDDTYFYYSGEDTYQQGHVFCLGDDTSTPPWHRLSIGDAISVEQEYCNEDQHKLLRFAWYMRSPIAMPTELVYIANGVVSFVTDGIIAAGDGLDGVIIQTPDNQLVANDAEAWVNISGATDGGNNGDFRLAAVPFNQGAITGGDRAVIEGVTARTDDTGVTIKRVGLKWVARAYFDSGSGYEEKVKLEEPPGHYVYRNELALHISQFTGASAKVKFEMTLEEA